MQPIPVSILTGFLGSGKTTLLNRLLQHRDMGEMAVLINEFGEIGLDHVIAERIEEEIVLLESGCVCCDVRDNFIQSLLDLLEKREAAAIPTFEQVVLETTGIADPASILQGLMGNAELHPAFCPGPIITVVDAVHAATDLRRHTEAASQVAHADRIVLAKTDLAGSAQSHRVRAMIADINPAAPITTAQQAAPVPLFARVPTRNLAAREALDQWLQLQALPGNGHRGGHRFSTFLLAWTAAVDWEDFLAWLDGLLFARGDQIYRLKGLVRVAGRDRPVVIQGVQHSLYPPRTLARWPGEEERTQLVFIARDFTRQAALASLRPFFPFPVQ